MKNKTMPKIKTNILIGDIPVIYFAEGGKFIAFSPALDISTCGNTEEQARTRFIEAAKIFINEIIKMGTVDDVLTECGWKKLSGTHESSWIPPTYKQELVKIPEGVC